MRRAAPFLVAFFFALFLTGFFLPFVLFVAFFFVALGSVRCSGMRAPSAGLSGQFAHAARSRPLFTAVVGHERAEVSMS